MKIKLQFLILLSILTFFGEKAYACHGLPIVNLQHTIPADSTSITITGESDAATSGCDSGGYYMQVELICDGNSYTETPNYFSEPILKPDATQKPYPPLFISFSDLCPGTTYKWRIREYINNESATVIAGPWSQSFTFKTPGQQPPLTLSLTANPVQVCPGQATVLTATAGGGCGNIIYNWNNGLGSGAVKTPSPNATTTYTVEAIDRCTGSSILKSITVTVGGAAVGGTVTANPTRVCQGGFTTLTLTGNNGTLQWQTSPNGATWTNVAGGTSNTLVLGPLNANTFVRARITFCSSNANSNTVFVAVTPTPTVSAKMDTTICAGETVTLEATPGSGGGTFLWSTGETTDKIIVSPTTTTTYSVVYSVLDCPSLPDSVTVTVKPVPIVTINDTAICAGDSVVLTATPDFAGGTYLWNTGETTNEITVNPASTTNYSVTYTLNGCTSLSDTGTVTVKSIPTVTVNDTSICETIPGTLNANVSPAGGTYLWSTAEITSQINVNPATTQIYSVTYAFNGCSDTANGLVTVKPKPVVTLSDTSICAGGSATLTPIVSAPGGTYLWSTGATTSSLTVSPSAETIYSLTYTLNECESDPVSAKVSVRDLPLVSVSDTAICPGESTMIQAVPAIAGGTYLWSTGETTSEITVTPAITTDYSVTYTLGGCTSLPAFSKVTVKPIPNLSLGDISICENTSGNLTANTTTPGGNFLWSPSGETTSSITVTPATTQTYTVIYTLNGCSDSANAIVTVIPKPTVAVNDTTICSETTVVLIPFVSVTGGTYEWNTGAVSSTLSVTPALQTTYSVVYNFSGCKSEPDSAIVFVKQTPSVTVNNETICLGDTAILKATVSVIGGTFLWTPGNFTEDSINVSPFNTTQYNVAYTYNGCTGTGSGIVTINNIPGVTAGPDVSICYGDTVTLTAGGADSYLWSPGGETTQSISVSPLDTAEYSVIGFVSGCSGRDTVMVNVAPELVVNATAIDAKCFNLKDGVIDAIATGGEPPYNYRWNQGLFDQAYVDTVPAGTYTVEVTDKLNCSVKDSVTVSQPAILTATKSQVNVTCNGGSDGSALVVSTSGGTAPYLYDWAGTGAQPDSVLQDLNAGTYDVLITDSNNCEFTLSYTITEPAPINLNPVADPLICVGQSTTLKVSPSGGNPGYSFNWDNQGLQADSFLIVSPSASTDYSVQVQDSKGCLSVIHIFRVNVRAPLNVTLGGPISICQGDSITLTANPSGGDPSGYTFNWTPGFKSGQSITVSPEVNTDYQVELKDGCTSNPAFNTISVNVKTTPVVNFTSDINSSCAPACVTFTDHSSVTGGNIIATSWSTDNYFNSDNNFVYCYNSPGVYDVSLKVTSNDNCSSTLTIPAFITIHPNPVTEFRTSENSFTVQDPTVNFVNLSTGAEHWTWNFGDNSPVSQIKDPSHSYDAGEYNVMLISESIHGCKDSIAHLVTVKPQHTIYIPNSFSPNGDGLNDVFLIKGTDIGTEGFEMIIFNRWGQIVFESIDMTVGWEGTIKGEPAQTDTYIYILTLKDNTGKQFKYTGNVNLIR